MDNAMTEKINRFSNLVLDDAEHQKEELLTRIDEEKKSRLEDKENEYLAEAYDEIQEDIDNVRKENNTKILKAETDARRAVLLKREEIIAKVFDAVKSKLTDYMSTPEYGKWLIDTARAAMEETGKGTKLVYVSEDDMRFEKEIIALGTESGFKVEVEAVRDVDFLGGVKVFNRDRRVTADYSLGELLEEQRAEFLQTSKLTID